MYYLARDGVGLSDFVSPVSTTNGNDRKLGQDDGSTDSSCDFFAALNSETDVTVRVADGNECLEASSLTGTGLFLDRHDLRKKKHFIRILLSLIYE
jgi:hypothetical protein